MRHADPFVFTLQKWIEISMHRSIRHFICFARENGLSMSQLGALLHVHHAGSKGVTDLGDHLGVTSAAASQMLDRLVQQELILRSVDPNDRRVKQIVLTDKGLQVLQESIRARQGWLYDLAETLSDAEKETILPALTMLIDKANYLRQPIEPDR
jgi:DNA-binding MarR family transcriptional regulator